MTKDLAVKHNTTFTGYAGLQAGSLTPAAGGTINTNGAILGAAVKKNGTYLKAEVGTGTAFTGKIEAGHEFDIAKNMGLDLSAKVQATKSNKKTTVNMQSGFDNDINLETNAGNVTILNNQGADVSSSWKATELRAGARAELKFKPSKRTSLGVGVEGGVKNSLNPDFQFSSIANNRADVIVNGVKTTYDKTYNSSQEIKGRKTQGYISPIFTANINLGKKNQIGLFADASLAQRQVGIKYNF
ncbi:hypothetical protein IKQ21_07490 [bacterium]|nr:hypothetical protein [bacterium]